MEGIFLHSWFVFVARFFKDVMQSARKSACVQDGNIDDFLGFIEIPIKVIGSL